MNSARRIFMITASVALALTSAAQKFRHVERPVSPADTATVTRLDSMLCRHSAPAMTVADSLIEIQGSFLWRMPRIFDGYRHISPKKRFGIEAIDITYTGGSIVGPDSAGAVPDVRYVMPAANVSLSASNPFTALIKARRQTQDIIYSSLIVKPSQIDYAYWQLPEPVRLPDDEVGLAAYIRHLDLPEVELDKALIPEIEIQKTHWLHKANAAIQFSQAYISPNWYQGGNNHLTLLLNLLWNVQLNQVYHPNLLLDNTVSYKLALNSNSQDAYHKYTISEDIFQWNFKAGVKAADKWFYSFTAQFKTQMFNNYETDSDIRKAGFLSPGDLNLGLGMTYSTTAREGAFKLSLSISPISYNLKTCIDHKIDPTQFNIKAGRRYLNEIGSTAEANILWDITSNINLRSRVFLFSDYKDFLADWENTISFNINKFLSTQIYVNLRYDTASEATHRHWRHLMLKEIFSFGFSYNFSTK